VKEQKSCRRKQIDGSLCGNTEDMTKSQNLCKRCKSKDNKRYKAKSRGKRYAAFWFKDAHDIQTMFTPFLIHWNNVTRSLADSMADVRRVK